MLQVVAYPVGGRWLGGSCTRTWSRLPTTAATDTATYILTNLLTYYLLLTTYCCSASSRWRRRCPCRPARTAAAVGSCASRRSRRRPTSDSSDQASERILGAWQLPWYCHNPRVILPDPSGASLVPARGARGLPFRASLGPQAHCLPMPIYFCYSNYVTSTQLSVTQRCYTVHSVAQLALCRAVPTTGTVPSYRSFAEFIYA